MNTYHIFSPQPIVNKPSISAMPQARNCRNVCEITTNLGHNVIHYGAEGSEVVCSEHVDVIMEKELDEHYGELHKNFGATALGHTGDPIYQLWLGRTFYEVEKRAQPGDYICSVWNGHRDISDKICNAEWGKDLHAMEVSVGYNDVWTRYRVFQSKAWRNFKYGTFHEVNRSQPADVRDNPYTWTTISNPYWFLKPGDTVIPNVVNCNEFTLQTEKEDYICIIGRIMVNKGVLRAVHLAKELGVKLKIAGAGNYRETFGEDPPAHVEVLGMVNVEERDELIGKAIAVICMPSYIEPFGNTAAEANAAGTGVICYPIGGPSEIVIDGVTGFHVEDFNEAVDALKNIDSIKPESCRKHIESTYNMNVISKKYDRYFKRIDAYIDASGKGLDEFYIYGKNITQSHIKNTEQSTEMEQAESFEIAEPVDIEGAYFEIGAGWTLGDFLLDKGWQTNKKAEQILTAEGISALSDIAHFQSYFVESVPQQVSYLQGLFQNKEKAHVIHAAISGVTGIQKMNVQKTGMGALELTHEGTTTQMIYENNPSELQSFHVNCVDLDTLFSKLKRTPDLLRIDIEGAEVSVLSAYSFSPKPIVILVDTHHINKTAVSQILKEQGYRVIQHPNIPEDIIGILKGW